MKKCSYYRIHSQVDLPFLETHYENLRTIFERLVLGFGLRKNSNQKLIDLGAGEGRIVRFSALKYGIHSLGIEINRNLVDYAKEELINLKKEKKYSKRNLNRIEIREGDLFQMNLKKFDFIYMFILPSVQKYLKHLILTMKRGAVIVSYKYPLDEFNDYIKLEYELEHEDEKQQTTTFFYRKF